MDCPECGTAAPEGAAWCVSCGSSLSPGNAAGPPEMEAPWTPRVSSPGEPGGVPAPAGARAPLPPVIGPCSKCGAQLHGGAFYCPACGHALAPGANLPSAPGSQGSKICKQCRRVGPADLVTCPHCGGAMQSRTGAPVVLAVVAVGGAILLGGGALLAATLVPNFLRARAQGQFTACAHNLTIVATALERWSTDHERHYPPTLAELAPKYLRALPTCPTCQQDSYSATYQVSDHPDAYTVACGGRNHQAMDVPAGNPQYNSVSGLAEK